MKLMASANGGHIEPIVLTKGERRERYMQKTRAEAGYLFKYLILTQVILYLEAGAIPCLLDQLSVSLHLDAAQQGALGGIVYLALSAASPFCAYFLHRFHPRTVLGLSLLGNNVAVLMLALTPTGYANSATMLIVARAAVGFTQAFPCIYTPLWVDEYAPRDQVAGWMSYLQGSVPMGVMVGYFAGTVSNWLVPASFALIETWRWPFLLQVVALAPWNVAIFFVPHQHLVLRRDGPTRERAQGTSTHLWDGCRDAPPSTSQTGTTPSKAARQSSGTEVEPLPRRASFLSARSRAACSLHHSVDDRAAGPPRTARSTTCHDEEDALLASASMYGVSSQRSVRQLHQNQQQYQLESTWIRRDPSVVPERTLEPREGQSGTLSVPLCAVSNRRNHGGTRLDADHMVPNSSSSSSTYGAVATAHDARLVDADDARLDVYPPGSVVDGVAALVRLPVFCLIVGGLTAVYFVVTGVQYWSTIFLIKSLHATKVVVNGLFVVISGTGPILGVFYGGWLIDRSGGYLGHDQRAHALGICVLLGLVAFVLSAVTTFCHDLYLTASCLWLLLFFGGAILPACTGIFISVVPAAHRALASSLSVMVFNLCGYALSPYLTGWFMAWVRSHHGPLPTDVHPCDDACAYRLGFRFCLCWSVWSVLCIGAAWQLASREAATARQHVRHSYAAPRPPTAMCPPC